MPEPSVLGAIDLPPEGATVAPGPVLVHGWVYSRSTLVSRVEIRLDEQLQGSAALARPRPDVASFLGDAAAEPSGFELRVDLRRLSWLRDEVDLRVTAILIDGERVDLPLRKIGVAGRTARQRQDGRVRLLCFARSLDWGGSQLRMRELIEHLAASGTFDITVLAPTEGPLRQSLEAVGASVRVEPIPLDRLSAYEEALTRLSGRAAGRFDVTLGFTLTSFAAVDLAERIGLPALWRIGECETLVNVVTLLGGNLDPGVELRANGAFRSASVVFFNSEAGRQFFRKLGHRGRFAVLGSGTDVEGASTYRRTHGREGCRKALGLAPNRRVLITAATVWPMKGQALLVAALARVHVLHPHLECVLIGQAVGDHVQYLSACGLLWIEGRGQDFAVLRRPEPLDVCGRRRGQRVGAGIDVRVHSRGDGFRTSSSRNARRGFSGRRGGRRDRLAVRAARSRFADRRPKARGRGFA